MTDSLASKEQLELTPQERDLLPTLPDALRALADWHDTQATMADGMDMPESSKWHTNRSNELQAEALRIDMEWENG